MPPSSSLRRTTLDLIELVHTVSGYRVVLNANPALTTTASVRMARGNMPMHTIEYNPELALVPDYYIAVQCGIMLRFYAPPPTERYDLVGTVPALSSMIEQFQRDVVPQLPGLDEATVSLIAAKLYHGLLRQLRTMPVELRVEAWIRSTYPEFESVQRASVLRQMDDDARSLQPEARANVPAALLNASLAMSAATAQYWAGEYLLPDLAKPYVREGHAAGSARLLAAWRSVPADAIADRELIDTWAQALNLRGWYDWVPYDAPA